MRQQQAPLGVLTRRAIGLDPFQELGVGVVGEDQYGRLEMLAQVGRVGVGSQRHPLGTRRGQQQHLGVAPLDVPAEHGGEPHALHRLSEDQVAFGQVDVQVFLVEAQVPDLIALLGIQPRLQNAPAEFRCRAVRRPKQH